MYGRRDFFLKDISRFQLQQHQYPILMFVKLFKEKRTKVRGVGMAGISVMLRNAKAERIFVTLTQMAWSD
jgi:hypothetical protein